MSGAIPDTPYRTIIDPLKERAESNPDRIFLRSDEADLTYAEIWDEVERVAGGLAQLGVGHGDHVALFLDNSPRFLITWFAVASLGAVEVPVNTGFHGDALAYVLDHSDAEIVVVDDPYVERIAELDPVPSTLKKIVTMGVTPRIPGLSAATYPDLDGNASTREVGTRDPAAVMYTSGTTGRSKGAMLSHRYFLLMAAANSAHMRLGADDTYYTCLPLFHGMAQLSGTMAPLCAGAKLALVPKFSVSAFWDDCRRFDATGFGAIAAMTSMLFNQPPAPDDREHSVRFAFSVAVPATIQRDFEERFGIRLIDGYGMTEGGQISYSPYDAPRVGSCGKPVPLYDVQIQDQDGNPLGPGEVGEIAVRPRRAGVIMDGYYKMPVETLEAFRDLWLHTGDVGRFDEDGYMYFVDRRKDVIRRRGENISSMEVEALVAKSPSVVEVAAYPVPSELGEDEVMIAVVLHRDSDADIDLIVEHCRETLPHFAVPRYVRIVDELPKTPTQKTEKYRLRKEGLTPDTWDVRRSEMVQVGT